METEHDEHQTALILRPDQPLIGIVLTDDDGEMTAYFAGEQNADAALRRHTAQRALSAIGAWSHLDWDEVDDALDRIRHESPPTPMAKMGPGRQASSDAA